MSTPHLFAALVKAQASARAVALDSKNEHHKYRYASAESLIEEGRSALCPVGLALIVTDVALDMRAPFPVDVENPETGEVRRKFVSLPPMLRATYVLAHESGESLSYVREWPALEQKGRPIDKAEGGALTTALGYAIRDVLMLPRDDEYADMDRRDDRDHKPANDARREEPRREPAKETPREAAREETKPAASSASVEEEWNDLLARVKLGESIGQRLGSSILPVESRIMLAFISRAWKCDDEKAFGKIGSEVRTNQDLSEARRSIVLEELRPAWTALQERAKRMKAAEAAGLEKAS